MSIILQIPGFSPQTITSPESMGPGWWRKNTAQEISFLELKTKYNIQHCCSWLLLPLCNGKDLSAETGGGLREGYIAPQNKVPRKGSSSPGEWFPCPEHRERKSDKTAGGVSGGSSHTQTWTWKVIPSLRNNIASWILSNFSIKVLHTISCVRSV